jgi:hypothetical protein
MGAVLVQPWVGGMRGSCQSVGVGGAGAERSRRRRGARPPLNNGARLVAMRPRAHPAGWHGRLQHCELAFVLSRMIMIPTGPRIEE